MPYAANNQISQDPIEGGIEISDEQYAEALDGMMEGKVVSIDGGFSVAEPAIPEPEEPAPLSKEERIDALQATYEIALEKLNKAWLAALIADGVGEVTRQLEIKQQMADLDAKLEIDILTILMEE